MNLEISPKIKLNLSEIPQHERHARIFEEFDALTPGEALEIVVDHEPKLLQRQFKTLRDGMYGWQIVESRPDLYRFQVLKVKSSSPEQKTGRVEGCCGVCGND